MAADPEARTGVMVVGHICLDVIPELPAGTAINPGHLVQAGAVRLSTGGAVANVGLALTRLGVPVELCCKLGDDAFGQIVGDLLAAVDPRLTAGLRRCPDQDTSYSIVVSPPGVDRAFLHCAGANDSFAADDVPAAALSHARIVHLGYPPLLRRLSADGGHELAVLLARIQAAGAVSSLDLCDISSASATSEVDWRQLLEAALPHVDLFTPSIDEFCAMLAITYSELDLHLLRRLSGWALVAGAPIVVLKLGDQGLYLRTGAGPALRRACDRLGLDREQWARREILSPCFVAPTLAGTTGSGDATIAGLLAALLRGSDPVQVVTAACAVGACSVQALDATSAIPRWSEVRRRFPAGSPRLPQGAALLGDASWETDLFGTHCDRSDVRHHTRESDEDA